MNWREMVLCENRWHPDIVFPNGIEFFLGFFVCVCVFSTNSSAYQIGTGKDMKVLTVTSFLHWILLIYTKQQPVKNVIALYFI